MKMISCWKKTVLLDSVEYFFFLNVEVVCNLLDGNKLPFVVFSVGSRGMPAPVSGACVLTFTLLPVPLKAHFQGVP